MDTPIMVGQVSLNIIQKKYERASYETALLAIFADNLTLKTSIFCASFKTICAIRHITILADFIILKPRFIFKE